MGKALQIASCGLLGKPPKPKDPPPEPKPEEEDDSEEEEESSVEDDSSDEEGSSSSGDEMTAEELVSLGRAIKHWHKTSLATGWHSWTELTHALNLLRKGVLHLKNREQGRAMTTWEEFYAEQKAWARAKAHMQQRAMRRLQPRAAAQRRPRQRRRRQAETAATLGCRALRQGSLGRCRQAAPRRAA